MCVLVICGCVWASDSRHGHVASVNDDVPELGPPRLIGQRQGVRRPQGLVEAGQTRHRRYGWVADSGGLHPAALGTRMSDGQVQQRRVPELGIGRLKE